jgi:hypothetical protein
LTSTAALLLTGIGIARAVSARPVMQRAMGAGIVLSGFCLMVG